jgi:hypothetical protein
MNVPAWVNAEFEPAYEPNPEYGMYARFLCLAFCEGDEKAEAIVHQMNDFQCGCAVANLMWPSSYA